MTVGPMSSTAPRQRVALIDQMTAEWQSLGRARSAVAALESVARRDPGLSLLVLGTGTGPPPCPHPL